VQFLPWLTRLMLVVLFSMLVVLIGVINDVIH
jgi:hypothetical protein